MTSVGRFAPVPATWFGWLLIGAYIFLLNVQGNVIPFLQEEFTLSYWVVSLHSSAIAVGVILVGLFGEHVTRGLGRRRSLFLAVSGLAVGAILLCVSPAAWASIASCFLLGFFGTLIPAVVPALLADIHDARTPEAYTYQSVMAYVFGLAAPLITGLYIWLGLDWRAAVLSGAAVGIIIAISFRRTAIPEPAARTRAQGHGLNAAFWAYWLLLACSCALEYSILIWAPAYLERVIGLAPASAATAAAAFPLGVLIGRIVLGRLIRNAPPRTLLLSTLAITFLGFLIYWGTGLPVAAIIGIFIIGLGIAPLYPLSMSFAVGAVRDAQELASVRLATAFGVSLLVAPAALGSLADNFGLGPAHLAIPGIIIAAYACFFTAQALEKGHSGL